MKTKTYNTNPVEAMNDAIWSGFIIWAYGQESIRDEFTKQTGKPILPPPTNGIEAAIDKACGVGRDATLEAFTVWVTEAMWGMDYAPQRFREKYAKAAPAKVE